MNNRTVMLVDDEPAILEALRMVLTAEGYEVVSAVHGQEALDKLENVRPDIILLDLSMPVMGGWEFMQVLRKLHIRPRIPVVIISAAPAVRIEKETAARLGACAFLAKPFEFDALLQLVSSVLEGADQPMLVDVAHEESARPPPDRPSAQENPAPPLERDVYPYVMGGLLHDALNVAASLQHFSHKVPESSAGDSNVASRMKVGLERLVRVLRLMQDISRAYYVPEQQAQEQETLEKVVDQYRRAHPEISYSVSQTKPLALPAGITTFFLGELLENATRACAGVRSPRIELRIDVERDGTASIICTDNGQGFPEALLERIRTGHIPRPDGVTLRGHGLYLMKEVIERLKGRLLCANRDEGGARVQLLLPHEERTT